MKHTEVGKEGEQIAAAYLITQGYRIVAYNFRAGRGEIDLIAQHKGYLIFVEVKTRSSSQYGYPEEAVTQEKAEQVGKTAQAYLEETQWMQDIRFDIIAITLDIPPTISHFQDAFTP